MRPRNSDFRKSKSGAQAYIYAGARPKTAQPLASKPSLDASARALCSTGASDLPSLLSLWLSGQVQ
jgi:hypothetical protein